MVPLGPKFNDPLYFQGDSLEVCGPANFGPNDVSLELLKVRVVDQNGVERHTPELSFFVAAGEMWEADIDDAKGDLAVGPARGFGRGRVTKRNGNTKVIEWADHFQIIDPGTFLDDVDSRSA